MPRARSRFTVSELSRIFKAAKEAGVELRVRIAMDGTITIATGTSAEAKAAPSNPWDEALNGAAEQKRIA
jgi:hypothetical protein